MNRQLDQIIFKGECIDSNDPQKLGRIRAIDLSIHDTELENGNSDEGKTTYKPWGTKDPYLYLPLLPWFNNVAPKGRGEYNQRGEYVHLFYSDLSKQEGTNDKYYVGPVISSPLLANNEPIISSEADLSTGYDNKKSQPSLINDDGTDKDEVFGVFPDQTYVTLNGRGTADIIIKDNDVLLRAGKSYPNENKKLPQKNEGRAFLQLSKFDFKTEITGEEEVRELKVKHLNIKKVVEYHINNLENTVNKFQGTVKVYHLDIPEITTNNMSFDTVIPEGKKQLQTVVRFYNIGIDSVSELINDFLKKLKQGPNIINISQNLDKYINPNDPLSSATIGNEDLLYNQDNYSASGALPLFFKMSDQMWNVYKASSLNQGGNNLQIYYNITDLISKIKRPGDKNQSSLKGYGLIYSSDKNNVAKDFKKQVSENIKIEPYDNSVGILGGNKLFMISHDTSIKSKGKINVPNSLMGVTENQTSLELDKKTSPLVRGDELLEFLNLVVRFLSSHVHAMPGESPNPTGLAETVTLDEINKALNEFSEKVLNKNIRIN
jgi:hypothetical protein